MTDIQKLWPALQAEPRSIDRLVFRRLAGNYVADIFVGIRQRQTYFIAFGLPAGATINQTNFNKLKDIKVELVESPESPESQRWLTINLVNPGLLDNFTTLCEDLIIKVGHLTGKALRRAILERLEHWQDLFAKTGNIGLTPEAQRGLFGELTFLHELISFGLSPEHALSVWLGPAPYKQDFRSADWAIEVKTTYGENKDKVKISSADQLADGGQKLLGLVHYWLENDGSGSSLLELIDQTFDLYEREPARRVLASRLSDVGFHRFHAEFYQKPLYTVRSAGYYQILDGFPRITPLQLQPGLEDVHYTLHLSYASEWGISRQTLQHLLQTYERTH